MAMEDPFFVVKDEVLKALLKTRDLYERWRMGHEAGDAMSPEEQEWASTELRNSLRSIEWDLEDLDDTVQIVEKNPAKFRIDAGELASRKAFIRQTRDDVERMKANSSGANKRALAQSSSINEGNMDTLSLSSQTSQSNLVSNAGRNNNGKYSRLATSGSPTGHASGEPRGHHVVASSTQELVAQQMRQQEQIIRQQDGQLSQMSQSVGSLRAVSAAIGGELDEQAVMLDEFGAEIEQAETKLDATMRKMAKVLNLANDRRQWAAIGFLSSAIMVVVILIFIL